MMMGHFAWICVICFNFVKYKKKTWKGEMIKKICFKRGERNDTYLTHVSRLLQSIDSLEKIEKNKSFQSDQSISLSLNYILANL
jgi:hypothetical protein